jgi:hypothetical protein
MLHGITHSPILLTKLDHDSIPDLGIQFSFSHPQKHLYPGNQIYYLHVRESAKVLRIFSALFSAFSVQPIAATADAETVKMQLKTISWQRGWAGCTF